MKTFVISITMDYILDQPLAAYLQWRVPQAIELVDSSPQNISCSEVEGKYLLSTGWQEKCLVVNKGQDSATESAPLLSQNIKDLMG